MEQSSHQYAGFWIRVLAGLIDMAILAAIGYALGGGEATQVVEAGKFRMGFFGVNFTGWRLLIPVLYTLIFWIWISATPGKYICGIKIIETDGKKLSWPKAILRYIGYIPSAFVFGLGFIWIAANEKKQGWHDKLAKTYVVKR